MTLQRNYRRVGQARPASADPPQCGPQLPVVQRVLWWVIAKLRFARPTLLLVPAVICSIAAAQDTVIITSADGKTPVARQGEIVDYTGRELRLKTLAGREEPIAAARVIEIKTTWLADHLRGRELRSARKLDAAIAAFQAAKEREKRPWARRQIMAELTDCHAENGRFDQAGDEFLRIAADDSTTQHFAVMPVAWRAFPPDAALESRAAAWLAAGSKNPAAAVLGASWLLSTGRRAEAIAALQEQSLKRGPQDDQRLAMLAYVQLWRTKLVTAKSDEVGRWKLSVGGMPAEIQPSGWYVVGDALARLDQAEEAALAYLRVPLVHGQPRVMAADALVAAGEQLEKLARKEQAAGLYREVLADYSTCPAASEAQTRLNRLAK